MRLVHPMLMQSLQHFHNSRCSISRTETTRNSFQEELVTVVVDQSLCAIPCFLDRTGGSEQRQPTQTIVAGTYIVQLARYCPSIDQHCVAVIDGTSFNVVDVVHDDTNTLTYLGLEIINAIGD